MIPLDPIRAGSLIDRFGGGSVLVVGDLMLDQFVVGRVTRISPEAPVPVVRFERDEYRPGGAANVAHVIHALGGRVTLVGVVGTDAPAERLIAELGSLGIGTDGIGRDPTRRTTTKVRIVTERHQQVARVDYEVDAEISGEVETTVGRRIEVATHRVQVILLSDYLKGTLTKSVAKTIMALARTRGIPVLIDPKIPHLDYYAGASLLTPNHVEAEAATETRIRTDAEALEAARLFRRRVSCSSVLITRGEHGMCLLDGGIANDGNVLREAMLPSVARDVADVTGAGDTVIGTIALGMAAGATLLEAAQLANHAAGIAVSRFGPVAVKPPELLAAVNAESGAGL